MLETFTVVRVSDYITDNDIVPENYQNELMQWRDVFRSGFFAIGDIANLLCDKAGVHGLCVTHNRVYDAVGKFCGRTGRTVRYYAETARFYSAGVRSEFDILPFSLFVCARGYDEWRKVLEYAMLYPLISEATVREFMDACLLVRVGEDEPAEEVEPDQDEPQPAVQETHEVSRRSVARDMSILSDLIDKLERIAGLQVIPLYVRLQLLDAVALIRKAVPKVAEFLQ